MAPGEQDPSSGMAIPAESRLQILGKSAAKAGFRAIPALSAPPEAPDCPTISNHLRPVWPPPLPPGLSHIRKQLEEEWPIPSCEVHLTGDGAWQRVRTQDVQRHASNDG